MMYRSDVENVQSHQMDLAVYKQYAEYMGELSRLFLADIQAREQGKEELDLKTALVPLKTLRAGLDQLEIMFAGTDSLAAKLIAMNEDIKARETALSYIAPILKRYTDKPPTVGNAVTFMNTLLAYTTMYTSQVAQLIAARQQLETKWDDTLYASLRDLLHQTVEVSIPTDLPYPFSGGSRIGHNVWINMTYKTGKVRIGLSDILTVMYDVFGESNMEHAKPQSTMVIGVEQLQDGAVAGPKLPCRFTLLGEDGATIIVTLLDNKLTNPYNTYVGIVLDNGVIPISKS